MTIFNKARLAERDQLVEKLAKAAEAAEAAQAAVLVAITAANEKAEAFNEILSEAREFRDGVVEDIEAMIEDKTEKWQEGEKGQAWSALKDEWENLGLDDIEPFDDPEEIDFSAPGAELEQQATEP